MTVLTVVTPFGSYRVGDRITDPEAVLLVLTGEHASKVVATGSAAAPAVPPVAADVAALQQQLESLTAAHEATQASLATTQASALASQQGFLQLNEQVGRMNLLLTQMAARLGPGNPVVPVDLSDDRPITTNSGARIRTMSGGTLVG